MDIVKICTCLVYHWFFIENHAFVIIVDVPNARFLTFILKYLARPV